MAIPTPETAAEVEHRAKIDVQRELPTSNPFLQNSWLGGLITGYAYRIYDVYLTLKDLALESLPDSAVRFLSRWAGIWGFTQLAATPASGIVVVTGSAATVIPLSTVFVASDGALYTSTGAVTIQADVFNIATDKLSSAGGVATCETTADHGLASNVTIEVTGATQPEYNVAAGTPIIVISANTFTYPITGSPITPATGSPVVAYTVALSPVTSDGTGAVVNQILDTQLDFQSSVPGADVSVSVNFPGIAGGADQEDPEVFRGRYLETLRNPVAHFNVADITRVAKGVLGVTRVFVLENTPAAGQVEIYFMRDGEDDGVPGSVEISDVDGVIQAIRPATTIEADVAVDGPTPDAEAYTFSAMSPNDIGMQAAVNASLDQFYAERASLGVNITEEDYQGAIAQAIDAVTGQQIISFALTTPTADLTIAATSIGTKGVVSFP